MSSKGQVVIPKDIRIRLGLKTGALFLVVGDHDVIILKTLTAPALSKFGPIIRHARSQAKAGGMRPAETAKTVARARGQERYRRS